MRATLALFFIAFILISQETLAQVRLALVKNERVLALWEPGDRLLYKLQGDRHFRQAFISDIRPLSLKVLNDSLALDEIHKVSLKGKGVGHLGQLVGGFLLIAGIGYPIIDLVNETLVQGNNYEPDSRVMTTSAIFIGVGGALILINPYGRKVGGKRRLLAVDPDSPFYRYF